MLHCFDVRGDKKKPRWSLQAHDEELSSFAVNPIIPGFIATGSADKTVKLWSVDSADSEANGNTRPAMVVSRNMDVGKVFSVGFAPDPEVGFRLAVAGSKGTLRIWDTSTNAAVRRLFGNRVASDGREGVKERVVGLEEQDEEEDEGENEDDEQGGVGVESTSAASGADSDDTEDSYKMEE
jgi:periodic tryptophan protein 1